MNIHTVKEGETVYSIAREYGISPKLLIETNAIKNPDRLAIGRELLILTPTRTYTARRGDTLEAISRRFSVDESELRRNNPALLGSDRLYPEEALAIKYPDRNHGIALLMGYLYKGCPKERLLYALPYLSHLVLSSKIYKNGRLHSLFDTADAVGIAKEKSVKPIMRIYSPAPYSEEAYGENFIKSAIGEAKREGYGGISLSIGGSEELGEFAFKIKKEALESGLSLFIECDGNICEKASEAADAVIINDFGKDKNKREEERIYSDFAEKRDASRTFIDLSPFAYTEDEAIPIDEAISRADRGGFTTEYDGDSMLCRYFDGKSETVYPSLRKLKAKLDLTAELGYLGYCVDIMRCETRSLLLLSSLFHLSPRYFSGGI